MAKILIREPLPPDQIVGRSLQFWAVALDVSIRHLYRQIERGRLRAYKLGDRTIATPDDIQKMLRAEPMGAKGDKLAEATPADEPAELCASSAGVVR